MDIYVLINFGHENDVAITNKLHRVTHLQFVAHYNSLTMIMTNFLCSKCNKTLIFMEQMSPKEMI